MDVDAWVRGFMSGMNSIQAASSTEQPGDGCRKFSLTQPPSEATLGNSLELKLGPYVQMSSKGTYLNDVFTEWGGGCVPNAFVVREVAPQIY